jgi:hypothetical protein
MDSRNLELLIKFKFKISTVYLCYVEEYEIRIPFFITDASFLLQCGCGYIEYNTLNTAEKLHNIIIRLIHYHNTVFRY